MFSKKINLHNKTTRNLLILLIFIVFSFSIFLFLIARPAAIGISYDWSPPLSLNYFVNTPLNSSWINNGPTTPGNYFYIPIFYWFLLNCHLNSIFINIVFLIFVFSFSAYFLYKLFKKINLPSWIGIIVGLLYITSSQLLLVTHHGYTSYLVSICFTPLLIYFYLSYIEKPKFATALIGAVIFNLAANQIQFFIINSIILLIFSCFYYQYWKSIIKLFVVFIIVNFLLSAQWLLVYLFNLHGISNFSQNLLQNSYQGFQQNSIMDIFYIPFVSWSVKEYLQSLHLKWFFNLWSFCQILIFGIPFVIYGIYRKKASFAVNKLFMVGFVLLALGFLLTKGRAEPFSWLGDWFYKLPLSGMFRDLNHFYYLITFSILWLFSLAIYILYINVNKEKYYQWMFFGILIVFLLINVFPYLLNVYQSRLHQYHLADAYNLLIKKYNQDNNDYRLLWLPTGFYVKYNDGQPYYSGLNPLVSMVTKENLSDLGPELGQPSLLTKILEFGYCSQIKNCTERFLGLSNVRDIINLKRDFSSTASLTDNRNLLRSEKYWTKEYYDIWAKNLSNTAKTDASDYYDIYQLSNEQYLPHIYVPKELSWIDSDQKNILDGIILTKDTRAGYLVNDSYRSNVNKLIVPLEFSEDSGLEFSHNDYQIITKLDVPEDGDYQMIFYQKHRGTTSPGVILTVKDLDLDNKEIFLEKIDYSENQLKKQNPFKSGYVFLRAGEYKLVLSNTVNNQNLVVNSSFEIGGWPEPTYDCASEESDYEVNKAEDHEHYLQFHNQQKRVCQTRVVGDLQPNQKYLFSYDVQHLSGAKPVICLKLNEQDYCHGISTMVDNNNWQHFEFVYEQGESDRALIYFYVPGSNNLSINNFDNFELKNVGLPETISFVKDKQPASYQVSNIEYRKINNTKYRVILKSASGIIPLVFTENFNPNWMAYVKSESEILSDNKENNSGTTIQNNNLPVGGFLETRNLKVIGDHQKINGYSNVWYYQVENGPKDIEIILEYKPQKLFIIGQYVAIITFGLIIIFFIVKDFLKISFIRN